MKPCSNKNCEEQNPQSVENFYKRGDTASGLYSRCKSCCKATDKKREEKTRQYKKKWAKQNQKEHNKKYYEANKGRILKRAKEYNKKNKDKLKNYALKRNYGITLEKYNKILASQNHKCAICEINEIYAGKKGLFVDHDHSGGQVRALLCGKCNFLIGHAQEDISILQRAIKYLKSFDRHSSIINFKEYKNAKQI